jgi:hypothetical protein
MRWGRPLWILVALLGLGLFIADTAASWPVLHSVCRTACHSGQPDVAAARTLRVHGISLNTFAVISVARDILFISIWFGMAALIVLHRPRDRGPLVAAFFLILFTMNPGNSVATPPGWQSLFPFFNFTTGCAYILFGFLFPDGRFVPRWTRWVALVGILLTALGTFFPHMIPAGGLGSTVLLDAVPVVLFATVLGAQVYRYRRVAGWGERQQIKWVLYGVGISVVGMIVLGVGYVVVPGAGIPGSLYDLSTFWLYPLVNTAIPISIAAAMLRSRLWDVDRVINRTLVYGSLTVSLAVIYIGGVVGLQGLAQAVTGQTSDLAIAIVTLGVAAIFNPWRYRVQRFIDRRFYRQRYDAARTLAAMSTRLRDDVDLDRLAADLTATVQETIQPAHVSLWLPTETVR